MYALDMAHEKFDVWINVDQSFAVLYDYCPVG